MARKKRAPKRAPKRSPKRAPQHVDRQRRPTAKTISTSEAGLPHSVNSLITRSQAAKKAQQDASPVRRPGNVTVLSNILLIQ